MQTIRRSRHMLAFLVMDKYRKLDAWKRAHELCIQTLRAIDACYRGRARATFDQLSRAVVSVEANIVEGYALRTTPQFRRHLLIAVGSAAETECLLNIAREMKYFDAERLDRLQPLADRTMAVLFGLLRSLH